MEKGLKSIEYIFAYDDGFALRGYVHEEKIKMNVFLLESNPVPVEKSIIIAYSFLTLIRLLATYVLESLDSSFSIESNYE